jgi:hypothetical protein
LDILSKDDRILKVLPDLDQALQSSLATVVNMGKFVVDTTARALGLESQYVRDEVMLAGLVSVGHFNGYLRLARSPPWSLALGDKLANLQAFARQPRPLLGKTAKNIHDLIHAVGEVSPDIVDGVALFPEASWSSDVVESGHKPSTQLVRRHKMMGPQCLQLRSELASFGTLMREHPAQHKIHRLQQRVDRVLGREPQRIKGRQAFLGELQKLATAQRASGRTVAPDLGRRLVASHARVYKQLGPERHAFYEDQAVEIVADRLAEMHALSDDLKAKIAKLKQEIRRDATEGPLCRIGSCRFSVAQRQAFEQRNEDLSREWPFTLVEQQQREAAEPKGPTSVTDQQTLENMDIDWEDQTAADQAFWMSWAACNRDTLRTSIFKFVDDVEFKPRVYRFVNATIHPLLVYMRLVEEVPVPAEDDLLGGPLHAFTFGPGLDFVYSDDPNTFSIHNQHVHVLMKSTCSDAGVILSGHSWEPLPLLLMQLPWPTRAASVRHGAAPSAPTTTTTALPRFLDTSMPEYAEWCLEDSLLKCVDSSSESCASGDDTDLHKPPPKAIAEDEVVIILACLEAERGRIAAVPTPECFQLVVRGSVDTFKRFGVPFDFLKAEAKSGNAEAFCEQFHLFRSASFSYKLYGQETCIALCLAWMHRMQGLYDVWRNNAYDAAHVFSVADMAWTPPPDFVALELDRHDHRDSMDRCNAMGVVALSWQERPRSS